MPLWTFKCGGCGAEREIILPYAKRDTHLEWCGACQQPIIPTPGESPVEGVAQYPDVRVVPLEPRVESSGIIESDHWVLQHRMNWVGVEGRQAVKKDGAYRMKLIMNDGSRHEVAHQKSRRTDG